MQYLDTLCQQCSHYKRVGATCPNLPPVGASNGVEIYILGEKPTQTDDKNRKAWSGVLADNVKQQLRIIGQDLNGVRYYNAVGCTGKTSAKKEEVHLCSRRVRDDIERVRPTRIICMGTNATTALFGGFLPGALAARNNRGRIIPYRLKDGTLIPVMATHQCNVTMDQNSNSTELFAWRADTEKFFDLDIAKWRQEIQNAYVTVVPPTICRNIAQVSECFSKLKQSPLVAFDFETLGLQLYKKEGKPTGLYSIGFAFEDGSSYAMPLWPGMIWSPNNHKLIMQALRKWVTEFGQQTKIMHSKFELHCILSQLREGEEQLRLQGDWQDTALLTALIDERRVNCKLKVAASLYLGHPNWSVDVTDVRKLPLNELLKYNAEDAVRTLELYRLLHPKIVGDPRTKLLYEELLLPSCMEFARIEVRGTPVDMQILQEKSDDLQKRRAGMLRSIVEMTGISTFNPASPQQVADYFVRVCGYTMPRQTASGGYSVSEEVLQEFVEIYDCQVSEMILKYRKLVKLDGTYVTGLKEKIFDDHKLHGTYNVVAAATGRTSSENPNMQNFPKRRDKHIRTMITPPPGHKIVSFDYGQIEARIFAVTTGDPTYCKFLFERKDTHTEVSKMVFGEEKAMEHRQVVKNGVFAILYGGSDAKVAATIGVDVETVKQLRNGFFSKFREFALWGKAVEEGYKQKGYITSLTGRRRHYPLTYNEMLNAPIQATASDLTLYSLTLLNRKYDVAWMIHDDLTFFLPDDEQLSAKCGEIMEAMLALPWLMMHDCEYTKAWVPLAVECAIGDNWADVEDVAKTDAQDYGMVDMKSSLERASKIRQHLKGL